MGFQGQIERGRKKGKCVDLSRKRKDAGQRQTRVKKSENKGKECSKD